MSGELWIGGPQICLGYEGNNVTWVPLPFLNFGVELMVESTGVGQKRPGWIGELNIYFR